MCGARCGVRTWTRWLRAANQRATATDFMAGALSVTITRGVISPVTGSAQSSTSRQRLSGVDSDLQGGDELCGALGERDRARQGHLGGVVNHRAQPPAAGLGLEVGEVRLPDTVAAHRRLHEGLTPCLRELGALGLVSDRCQQTPDAPWPASHSTQSPRRSPHQQRSPRSCDTPTPATAPWAQRPHAAGTHGCGRCARARRPARRTSKRRNPTLCGSSQGPRRSETLRTVVPHPQLHMGLAQRGLELLVLSLELQLTRRTPPVTPGQALVSDHGPRPTTPSSSCAQPARPPRSAEKPPSRTPPHPARTTPPTACAPHSDPTAWTTSSPCIRTQP